MADTKISQLPAYTGNAKSTDYLVIVDNTTTPGTPVTKRINVGQITPTPVTPYSASLSASYSIGTSIPFYSASTTSTANWALSAVGTTTALAATISDGTTTFNITSGTSGTTSALLITGLTIGGTATGTGSDGASTTVNLTGSVPAVTRYTPAFYQQTANSTPPTWTTATTQTPGSQIGATITFPSATASTQYDWIATTQPVTKVLVVTTFGNFPITADVTTTAVISGTTFNVFGITTLTTGQALQLIVSA